MTSEPGPRPLTRAAGKPLWAQLRADLLRRLEEGEFRDVFPGEHDLVAEYQVSRHTVREALPAFTRRKNAANALSNRRSVAC